MITFKAMGRFDTMDDAMKSMVHIKDTFVPNMETHKYYDWLYSNVFTKTYSRLKPLYEKNYN